MRLPTPRCPSPTAHLCACLQVDKKDRPKVPCMIVSTTVFVNPFKEVDELIAKGEKKAQAKKDAVVKVGGDWEVRGEWYSNPLPLSSSKSSAVGKYMKKSKPAKAKARDAKKEIKAAKQAAALAGAAGAPMSRKRPKKTSYGGFGSW